MDTCKYIHYEVDADDIKKHEAKKKGAGMSLIPRAATSNGGNGLAQGDLAEAARPSSIRVLAESEMKLVPPQWVQCDLRSLDLSFLGKFSIIMVKKPTIT